MNFKIKIFNFQAIKCSNSSTVIQNALIKSKNVKGF